MPEFASHASYLITGIMQIAVLRCVSLRLWPPCHPVRAHEIHVLNDNSIMKLIRQLDAVVSLEFNRMKIQFVLL